MPPFPATSLSECAEHKTHLTVLRQRSDREAGPQPGTPRSLCCFPHRHNEQPVEKHIPTVMMPLLHLSGSCGRQAARQLHHAYACAHDKTCN